MKKEELGPCPLCGADMVGGPSVDQHHLVPRCKKGTVAELVHVVCHRKVHSTLAESELNTFWNTWSRLREHEEIAKYVRWVRRQFSRDPEYIDVHRDTRDRKRRRGR